MAPEVNAGEAEDRFFDDSEVGFDGGLRRLFSHARQVHRNVEHRAPSGKSIPRKKMSLQPLWVRSIRTGVRSRSERKYAVHRGGESGYHGERIVGGMSGARIQRLPRTERTLRRTCAARVRNARP